jgi:hypothetical protein
LARVNPLPGRIARPATSEPSTPRTPATSATVVMAAALASRTRILIFVEPTMSVKRTVQVAT